MQKKSFALHLLTGIMALFGLNEAQSDAEIALHKASVQDPLQDLLPLNGQLFTQDRSPDVVSVAEPAPAPLDLPFGVELTGPGIPARLAANDAARAEILKPEPDLAVLRAYSGTGGLGADSGSVDQFYTPAGVGRLMWQLATTGLKLDDPKVPVRALEPACGSGALLAQAPAGVLLTGVEMDAVAARAAQALLPHASVHVMPLEHYTTRSSDALFDVTVMNPPFGPRGQTRDLHCRDEVRSERYFMEQAIRRTRHGGTLVALLPLSLLHGARHAAWRESTLRHAMVIHAALVPEGAFKAAGAGVTTALLVLRRHDVGVAEGLSLLTAQQLTDVLVKFTVDHGHQALLRDFVNGGGLVQTTVGTETRHAPSQRGRGFHLADTYRDIELGHGRYGNPTLSGALRDDFSEVTAQLQAALRSLPVTLHLCTETVRSVAGETAAGEFARAARAAELHPIAEGTMSTDRRYCFRLGKWEASDDFAEPRVAQAAEVAQALEGYLHARAAGRPETARRRALAEQRFRAYRRAHGNVDRRRFLRLTDRYPLFSLLLAHTAESGELILPADAPARLPVQGSDLATVAGELADLLALTEARLAEYAGVSRREAAAHLLAHYAFTGEIWVEQGLYYSGHAIQKAEEARRLASSFQGYERDALNAQADEFLRRVRRVPVADLRLVPRDAVIPVAAVQGWVNAYLGAGKNGQAMIEVRRERGAVKFALRAAAGDELVEARSWLDAERARALEAYLNHRTEVDQVRGAKEMSREQYNAERASAIEEAQAYEAEVTRHFQNWLPESEFASVVEEAYTFCRGAMLRAEGSTRPLHVAGYRGKPPHPYQLADARSMAMTTGMVNNYDVGLGKTIEMLLLIGYLKMCGRANRPIISVPAGLVSNWATNAREAYPDWNIVTVGMSVRRDREGHVVYKRRADGSYMLRDGQRIEAWVEDSPAVKKAKIASLAAGNVDLIIMSREALTGIPMQRETRQQLILGDPQYLRDLETADRFEGHQVRGRHQQLVKQLGVFGAMMSRVAVARPGDLSFELLGCDFLGHDEAHGLKNLHAPPTVFSETPKFLGGGGESQRALDALHKGRYVREHGGSTFSFTASWVKNSPLEVQSMLSMVTDALPDYGLPTGEALMDRYIQVEPDIITENDGSVEVRQCVKGFRRLRELRGIIRHHVISRTYGDPEVVTRSGEPLQVPEAVAEEVLIDMSAEQAEVYAALRARARAADARAKGPEHPFAIMWEMRKLTIDPLLRGVAGPNPRFEKITELALDNRAQGGKGIVFLSVGEKQGSFQRLKDTLVRAGYPAHEIAIVSSDTHKSSVARQDLEDHYNYGDLTLILGTDVLGQGFNLQVGTTLIVNADIPWNFEEIRQRVGRGARQGNTVSRLRNVYLLMRGSFDTITYTIMSGKQSWLSQLWNDEIDELGNAGVGFSGEEMALLMSDDVEETRRQIAMKRADLEERTGRAALRRNLETLSAALNARDAVQQRVHTARERKHGVTARDHARIREARATFEQRRESALRLDFPLARLVDYRGEVFWFGYLPVHQGMSFIADNARYTVRQITAGSVMAVNDAGVSKSFTSVQLGQARDFLPSTDEQHYGEVPGLSVPNISLDAQFRVFAVRGEEIDPKPKSPENVVSISVLGQTMRLEHPEDGFGLRARLLVGETVMHFQTETRGDDLIVKQVAVIANSAKVIDSTRTNAANPALHARLLALVARAVGAQPVSSLGTQAA